MSLLEELKRRKVYRVAIAYVVGAWVALQFLDPLDHLVRGPVQRLAAHQQGARAAGAAALGQVPGIALVDGHLERHLAGQGMSGARQARVVGTKIVGRQPTTKAGSPRKSGGEMNPD